MRSRPMTGKEGMVGLVGVTKTALTPTGASRVSHGELGGPPLSDQPVEAGVQSPKVMGMDGLTLRVRSTLKEWELHDASSP